MVLAEKKIKGKILIILIKKKKYLLSFRKIIIVYMVISFLSVI
jgi:hypothetical protein